MCDKFDFQIENVKKDMEDKKKAENRLFENIDDVWIKLKEELVVISES